MELAYQARSDTGWRDELVHWSQPLAPMEMRRRIHRRWWRLALIVPALALLGWVHQQSLDLRPESAESTRPLDLDLPPVPEQPGIATWAPERKAQEAQPSDHLRLPAGVPVQVRVVTIRCRVTGYTAYDHAVSKPEWADGLVAWYPGGRKRPVARHPYGVASDWSQFPPGATFVRVPGYLDQGAQAPTSYRVIDDGCGAARSARNAGRQPVLDLRFPDLRSVQGHGAWGVRQVDVEVVFPAGHVLPSSLRRWVVREEWRVWTG